MLKVVKMFVFLDQTSNLQETKLLLYRIGKPRALSFLLHCCDISFPAKSWEVQHRWATSLFEEYWLQGDKEKELGLPVSPLYDRNTVLIEASQIGNCFITFSP